MKLDVADVARTTNIVAPVAQIQRLFSSLAASASSAPSIVTVAAGAGPIDGSAQAKPGLGRFVHQFTRSRRARRRL